MNWKLFKTSIPTVLQAGLILVTQFILAETGICGATQDQYKVTEIVVTATPLPSSIDELGRAVEIVDEKDISVSGATSVPEALERLTSVSVSERGDHTVQSDLTVRGATFQQVLLTINGLPATDPQTAHHNMDLPFPLMAVERIDVIPGPGSALFGPTAFGGTVNVVTRIPEESGFRFLSSYGSFETWKFGSAADIVRGDIASTFTASYAVSDGFQTGTDYELWSVWGSSLIGYEQGNIRVSVGHTDKDFGAQDFYAAYPSREFTSITMVDLAPEINLESGWQIKGIAQFRRHEDEFILIEDDPSYYRNEHTKESLTERALLISPQYALGRTALGIERSDSFLDSSNLGDRDAFINSTFVQHRLHSDKPWTADIGLRTDHHDRWGTEVSPSLSVAAPLSDSVKLRAAGGHAIRPPSFTELYYSDPANIGNPDLEPEQAWGTESGIDIDLPGKICVSATYFLLDSRDLIDWVRATSDDPWEATNIGEATTQGAETSITGPVGPLRWRTAYRYTDMNVDSAGLESKYALNYARHDVSLGLRLPETLGFSGSVEARYRDVPTLDRYWLASARVGRKIGHAVVFVQGKNLLDEEYQEIPGVPTAGSSLECGIELKW